MALEERCLREVLTKAQRGSALSVCDVIDRFCTAPENQNWMMNVGDVKGGIVDEKISQTKPLTMLELGTYVGYSSVRFARLMDESASARYFSVDVNPQTTHIAQQIAAHAGLADRITYLVGAQGLGSPEVLSALQKAAPRGFDCVFIDHYKPCYLPDLRLLEKAGLLRVGTRVIGDNIIYPGAPEYLAYVQQSPCYKTELIQTQLEYSDQADAVTISDVVSTSFGTE